jgi:hypothetical protein
MKYFASFPRILYTFDKNLIEFKEVVDIFTRVRMLDSIINNISVYYTYQFKDSDTVEGIASKYYKDPNRHWLILFSNKILDPYFELPLSQEEFEQNLKDNFGSVANSQSTLHHIEKQTHVISTKNGVQELQTYVSLIPTDVFSIDGSSALPNVSNPIINVGANTTVTFSDGTLVDTSTQLIAVSAYDEALNKNEKNRNIKLIKSDFVSQIEIEFKTLLNQ